MVRHHMRSRRGGIRGGSSHPQTDLNPEPTASSPSPEFHNPQRNGVGRYPSTRSGWGHARTSGVIHGDFVVHSTNFPLPLHPQVLFIFSYNLHSQDHYSPFHSQLLL